MDSDFPREGSIEYAAYQKWKTIPPDLRASFASGVGLVSEAVTPLLQRLANEAWMRQDFATNRDICELLGERTALEHELGEDAP